MSPKKLELRGPHVATAAVVRAEGHELARELYAAFDALNAEHFGGKLGAPLVLITNASSARTLGDYCPKDVHGLESRIRVSPAAAKRGLVFALDVLLHEMIHAWQHEIDGDEENGYRGHGPRFAAKCNEIGAALGLAPVGVKGRDGKPDCKAWPMNVRPAGYYPEAFKAPTRKPREEAEDEADGAVDRNDEGESSADVLRVLRAALRKLDAEQLEELGVEVERELRRR